MHNNKKGRKIKEREITKLHWNLKEQQNIEPYLVNIFLRLRQRYRGGCVFSGWKKCVYIHILYVYTHAPTYIYIYTPDIYGIHSIYVYVIL